MKIVCKICGKEIKLNAFGKVPNQNRGERDNYYCDSHISENKRNRRNEKRINANIKKRIENLNN